MSLPETTKIVTQRERELEEQNAVLQGQVHELYTRVKDLEYELGLAQDAIGLAAKMGFR
jgi:cell division protein FtsB